MEGIETEWNGMEWNGRKEWNEWIGMDEDGMEEEMEGWNGMGPLDIKEWY